MRTSRNKISGEILPHSHTGNPLSRRREMGIGRGRVVERNVGKRLIEFPFISSSLNANWFLSSLPRCLSGMLRWNLSITICNLAHLGLHDWELPHLSGEAPITSDGYTASLSLASLLTTTLAHIWNYFFYRKMRTSLATSTNITFSKRNSM